MISKENLVSTQRRIGLTGGIASGKTTIANYISSSKNIALLDADHFSRELIVSGTKAYKTIISQFGNSIINDETPSQEINRKKLKKIIFQYPNKKIWLENLLHPLIKEKMINQCQYLKQKKVLLLVIPLLFEANFIDLCTEIWIVRCSKKVQMKRLIARDKISQMEAQKIIDTQMDLTIKEKENYIFLNNENDKGIWQQQIKKLL